jgi:hypothetical protein
MRIAPTCCARWLIHGNAAQLKRPSSGDNWDKDIWDEKIYFDGFKAWALK